RRRGPQLSDGDRSHAEAGGPAEGLDRRDGQAADRAFGPRRLRWPAVGDGRPCSRRGPDDGRYGQQYLGPTAERSRLLGDLQLWEHERDVDAPAAQVGDAL